MARDLDFRPKRPTLPTAPATRQTGNQPAAGQPASQPAIGSPPRTPSKPKVAAGRWAWWALALVIIGLGLLGIALYAQTTKPLPGLVVTDSQTPTAMATGSVTTTATATAHTQPTIQVYDGGSGESAASAVIKSLKSAGFTTESLGKSQFEYDKTFIYYRTAFTTQAESVAAALTGREVTLKESKIEGSFDILIYLGKK